MIRTTAFGFTLIELLVVITLLATILGVGLASYSGFNQKEKLRQSALTLKSVLRLAHTKAMSAEKPSSGCTSFVGIEVTFTSTTYATGHECSPEGVVGILETYTLPSDVTLSPVPSGFTFQTGTNRLDITADQTLTLTNGSQSYVIVVSPNGNVNDEGFQ